MNANRVLEGRKALVTGASKGVGKGIALGLGEAGCDLAVNYFTDRTGGEDTVRRLGSMGRRALLVQGDVGRASDVRRMFDEVLQEFGTLDILVNNAGITTWGALLDLSEEDWDRTIATNLKGTFLCTQMAGRHMKERGCGRIINIGSGANKAPFPNLSAYNASKGGINMLTVVSAVELGPFGITVNCVAPGTTEVERTKRESPDYEKIWGSITPMRRVGYPEDVAHAVKFLASDEAAFVTGQVLYVDGGLWSQIPWPYGGEGGQGDKGTGGQGDRSG